MKNDKITDSYNDFYKLTVNTSRIEIDHVTGLLTHMITSNRTLLDFGLFLIKEGGYIKYLPGSYDVDGNFYYHPIRLDDNLILVSLKQTDYYDKNTLGILESEKSENLKGIEVLLHTMVGYEVTPFTIYSSSNNHLGLYNAIKTLHYIRLFLQEGLKLEELNPNFTVLRTVKLMQSYTDDCYKRIVDFAYSLKFFEGNEVLSRLGKDNRIESKVVFYEEGKNKYFTYLLNTYTDFKTIDENKFSGKSETDYGYVSSSKYSETEMKEIDVLKYRNEIIDAFIKNYDPDREIVYHFYKK